MASGPHVGDIGTAFQVFLTDENGVALNVSSADVLQIWFLKPDGVTFVVQTATAPNGGADGLIQYVTVAGDLDQAGTWKYQGHVEASGGIWTSDIAKQKVIANLNTPS